MQGALDKLLLAVINCCELERYGFLLPLKTKRLSGGL